MKTFGPHTIETSNCVTCNAPLKGRFCYQCGEKKLEREEMTLRYFFGTVWNALTFTDVKFMRTIGALLFKPGKLTREYFVGRRKLYTAPLALFFFINLVYFIYQPVDALNSTLTSQMSGQTYSTWASQLVSDKLEDGSVSIEQFTMAYNQMSSQVSKLFLVVFVLFFAVGISLVNAGRKSLFYFHLITATHYVSFAILSLLIILPLLVTLTFSAFRYFTQGVVESFNPNAWYVTLPMLLLLSLYAFVMQKRLYTESTLISLLKALLLFIAFALSVVLYRLFLFVVVMLLM